MNIVIYSYNFFPQADPESYCSTRFASALARAGHNVTVVTMDWPMQVSKDNYNALVAEELKIVRLPFSHKKNSPIKALFWYGHKSQMAVDVPRSVDAVSKILKNLDHPILITRAMPVCSALVGLRTSKYAKIWIAHFSDPAPWMGYADTIGHRLLKRLEENIVHKTFDRADGISVTCRQAMRYFKDYYGKGFDSEKTFILTHIGDYRLGASPSLTEIDNNNPVLLHTGMLFSRRGGMIIPRIMKDFKDAGYNYKFIQVGNVDPEIQDVLKNEDNIEIHNTVSLEKSLEMCSKAKVLFIPDVQSDLGYSPVLPSKFVYRIMDNQPIVVYSYKDSALHDYATEYPEAGVFWAEMDNIESLKNAIVKAMNMDVSQIDRTSIRKCFAEDSIVSVIETRLYNIYNQAITPPYHPSFD